jgi:hypothetical protein
MEQSNSFLCLTAPSIFQTERGIDIAFGIDSYHTKYQSSRVLSQPSCIFWNCGEGVLFKTNQIACFKARGQESSVTRQILAVAICINRFLFLEHQEPGYMLVDSQPSQSVAMPPPCDFSLSFYLISCRFCRGPNSSG